MDSKPGAKTRLSMVDETFTDQISVEDRGLAFGDGLFESMLLSKGKIPLLERHLSRLLHGCHVLRINIAAPTIRARLQTFLETLERQKTDATPLHAKIKLIVTRGRGGAGCYPGRSSEAASTVIQLSEIASRDYQQEVNLRFAQFPLFSIPELVGIKHLSRLPYIAAMGSHYDGSQEIVFFDQEERVVETMHHNIFFVSGARLVTPKLSSFGVAGVASALITEDLAKKLELEVVEEDISLDAAINFDACFIANAVRGVSEVARLENYRYSKSPLCAQVRAAFYACCEVDE